MTSVDGGFTLHVSGLPFASVPEPPQRRVARPNMHVPSASCDMTGLKTSAGPTSMQLSTAAVHGAQSLGGAESAASAGPSLAPCTQFHRQALTPRDCPSASCAAQTDAYVTAAADALQAVTE